MIRVQKKVIRQFYLTFMVIHGHLRAFTFKKIPGQLLVIPVKRNIVLLAGIRVIRVQDFKHWRYEPLVRGTLFFIIIKFPAYRLEGRLDAVHGFAFDKP